MAYRSGTLKWLAMQPCQRLVPQPARSGTYERTALQWRCPIRSSCIAAACLHQARIAYESWGELNAARDNAILALFTGSFASSPRMPLKATARRSFAGLVATHHRARTCDRYPALLRDLREFPRQLLRFHRRSVDQSGHRRSAIASTFPESRGRGHRACRLRGDARAWHRTRWLPWSARRSAACR